MNGRFARLKPEWVLRGWTDIHWALVNWKNSDFWELGKDGFYVAQSCDGKTDFDSMAFLPKHKALLNKFIAYGIAEECQSGETLESGQDYRKAENPVIRGVLWSITGLCNLNCRHCYMEASSQRFSELSLEEIQGLINQFERANVPELALTGGEPFMRQDLKEIIETLTKKKIGLAQIFTNATIVSDSVLDSIKQFGHRPFFAISFDGCHTHDYMRGVQGIEAKTIEGIKKVKTWGFPVTIITSVDMITRNSLIETYELMKELAVDGWWLAPPLEVGHWRDASTTISLDEMVELCTQLLQRWLADKRPFDLKIWRFGLFKMKEDGITDDGRNLTQPITPDSWNCNGTHNRPCLLHDGTLIPCSAYTGTNLLGEMPNLLQKSLSELWTDSTLRHICDLRKSDVIAYSGSCAKCEFFGECGAGCRIVALIKTGDLLAKDPIACSFFRAGYVQRFRDIVKAGRLQKS